MLESLHQVAANVTRLIELLGMYQQQIFAQLARNEALQVALFRSEAERAALSKKNADFEAERIRLASCLRPLRAALQDPVLDLLLGAIDPNLELEPSESLGPTDVPPKQINFSQEEFWYEQSQPEANGAD